MKNFDDYPRFLTPTEAAEILRISRASFYKRVWKGELPTIKLGGSLRVDKKRLEEFLDSRTRGGSQ